MRLILRLFPLACTLAVAVSVRAAEPSPEQLQFFERKVRPLLHEKCGKCHSSEKAAENGELALDSGAGIAHGGSRGKAVTAGKPDESVLIHAVRYKDTELQMPPEGKLSDAEIGIFEEWIRTGAVVPADLGPSSKSSARVVDIAAGKMFWSFQPLAASSLPSVARNDWPRTRTDTFLLAKIEAAGLGAGAEADRRTLIRRATFDLTGLPPGASEVEAFVADERPDAYDRLIERLLSSPHYGERAARFWLDLARYTDVAAPWEKSTANAWIYRDWVVRAMNEDVPYDRFVRLQLAADLIPGTPPDDLAALGFRGLSPTYWKELKLAPPLIQMIVSDEWDEQIDAVSRTFLGLTVACARCHHHKFDPIATEDYYGLAGVFASSQLADRPLLPEPQAAAVRAAKNQIAAWDAELKKIKEQDSEPAQELKKKIEELRLATPGIDDPWAHVVDESSVYVVANGPDATKLDIRANQPRDVPVFRRGSPTNVGEIVPRRFLAVLSPGEPKKFTHGSGRLDLAEAILTEAQPLAARVIVNRIWAQHFGQGIVRTVSDFGSQGERPTHPELLDDLARRLIENGWSLKWLHRELMLSAAYRQGSGQQGSGVGGQGPGKGENLDNSERVQVPSPPAPPGGIFSSPSTLNPPPSTSADPDNRLLARMPRRRLEIEAWRDALLAASGQFDPRLGGPTAPLEASTNHRRTLYGTVGRYEQNAMLKLYDFPEPTAHSPSRQPTTTPLQQLFVLNSPFVQQCAAALAKQSLANANETPSQRITAAYRRLFQRPPTSEELALGEKFFQLCSEQSIPAEDSWTQYAHALLGLNELMFVD